MLRKSLVITAALGTVLAGADSAAGQTKPGWYGQVSVGGLWFQSVDGNVSGVDVTVDYDTGYAVWAAGGYRFGNGFRAELELSYGRVGLDKVKLLGTSVSIDADVDIYSGTANLFYDVNTGTFATPYIGGGLGVVHSRTGSGTATVGGTTVNFDSDSSTDFTAFGELGLALRVADGIEIVPAYRYQWINNGTDGLDDDTAHIGRIGVRFSF